MGFVNRRSRKNKRRKHQISANSFEALEKRQLLATLMASNVHLQNHAPQAEMIAQMSDMTANNTHNNHAEGSPTAAALVDTAQATHTVVASGNWSDTSVWQNNTLPTAGARIVVPQGMTLTVDGQLTEEFKTIRIDGALRFATDVNTELRVDTIVSTPQGRFEMGTATRPISADVTARVVFADDGAIDRNWDPSQLSRGALLQGPVEIQGTEKTERITLSSQPAAGATTLELGQTPRGWNVGDQIVITGTQGSTSDEVRTILRIEGNQVTLNEALRQDHITPKADLSVYVANKTRNVEFTSENTATLRRGHVMFMHNQDVKVANAAFNDLGRTDKTRPLDDFSYEFDENAVGNATSAPVVFTTIPGPGTNVRGRYPIHFHRGGVDPSSTPAVIEGSVVLGSPGWGFVNHSSNVIMNDNITYGVQGAAFYTEAGDEIGAMNGNIAIRTVNPNFTLGDGGAIDPDLRADAMDFGVDGDGFWLSGHMVSISNNVAAGASGHGIIIWSDGIIEGDLARGRASVQTANVANGDLISGRDTIPTWWAPLAEISNNEAFGTTIGFRSRYVHSAGYLGEVGSDFHTPPPQAYIDTLTPTIDGLTVWGSRDGALLNYNERLSLKNARLIGIGADYVQNGGTADTGVGIDMYNEVTRGPGSIENVTIEGFNMGILAPRNDAWTMTNIRLSNTTDMLITEARQASRSLSMNNVTFDSLEGTAVASNAGQRRNIVMTADLEADGHQPYWFLLSDRITIDGQGLYFQQQAAEHVPLESLDQSQLSAPVSNEFVGLTNQQLQDTYGTSFGGAITPSDATSADFVTGGLVGNASGPASTSPPLYNMASEGASGIVIDPGTLTNFGGVIPVADDPDTDDPDTDPDTDDPDTDPDTDDPDTDPDTDDPDTDPDTDDPDMDPDTDEPDMEPDTDEPDMDPDTDEPDMEPDTDEPDMDPDNDDPDTDPDTDEPDMDPDTDEPDMDPDNDDPDTDPDTDDPDTDPDTEDPDMDPDTDDPDTDPDTDEPDMDPDNDDPDTDPDDDDPDVDTDEPDTDDEDSDEGLSDETDDCEEEEDDEEFDPQEMFDSVFAAMADERLSFRFD